MAKEKKEPQAVSQNWLTTYGDMITLMLCFFVMLFDPNETDAVQLAALTASITGDPTSGGQSLSTTGRLANLGNTVSSLPSIEKGKSLGIHAKRAMSLFAPEINSNKITLSSDERGVVISLVSDSFFRRGSADLNIEETRDALLRISQLLSSDGLRGRRFRIEGHTDYDSADLGDWPSNWELSAARAVNVLHYLSDFGSDEERFSVAGYADTRPKYANDTEEGRAYNRRVDIIILDEGHF